MSIFIFRDYEKYMKSSNRFKSYLISNLNNIRNIIELDDVFVKFKKELLTYLFNKKEVKVTCKAASYEIELYKDENNEKEQKELDIDDNISECSTVDLNKNDEDSNEGPNEDNCEDCNEDANEDDYNNQTYLVDADDSDEESLIEIAMSKVKLEDIKPSELKKLNNHELRNILRNNGLTISKNGLYLTKKDLIKKLLSERKKQMN